MNAGAQVWERAYRAAATRTPPTPNALACRRRREKARAAGLCIFAASHGPGDPLCRNCRDRQSVRLRERYREQAAREGRTVRPCRRRKGGRR